MGRGGCGVGAAAGPAVPPGRAKPLTLAHCCPTALPCPAGGTRPGGLTLRGVALSMAWAAGSPPWQHPTLLPALFFFLFFNLMLLRVLSCLYENKNNLRASAGAQPLPKALPAPGGSAWPPTPQNAMTKGGGVKAPRAPAIPDRDLCLQQGLPGWSSHQLMTPCAPGQFLASPQPHCPPAPSQCPLCCAQLPTLSPRAPNKPQRAEPPPFAPPLHSLGSRLFLDPQRSSQCPGECGLDPGCLPVHSRGQEGLEPR